MRSVPLLYLIYNGDPCVIASKGGSHLAPDWLLNIRDDPGVLVQIGGVSQNGSARIVSEEERAELWPRFVASYPGYEGYQAHTTRQFPIVIIKRPGG